MNDWLPDIRTEEEKQRAYEVNRPDVRLAEKWKNEPNQSVWRDYKRDDLGNPIVSVLNPPNTA